MGPGSAGARAYAEILARRVEEVANALVVNLEHGHLERELDVHIRLFHALKHGGDLRPGPRGARRAVNTSGAARSLVAPQTAPCGE